MRILRVAQKLYPDVNGGGAYHAHAMSRDQAEMGHDVTVITVRNDPELPAREEREGYTVLRYDPTVSALGNDISLGVAKYLASVAEFDVMHAHSHLYFSTNLAALRRRVGGPPLAITNHGLYSQNVSKPIFDVYLRTVGRWTFNRADVVFCYTETDRERVRDLGVSSRISVVPNGIDTERFTSEGREHGSVAGDDPSVLFVGRLVEGKRPLVALETFAVVREEYPDARLYVCGEGPKREEIEARAADLGIADAVTFLGQVPYEDMPAVYRGVDALVLPSQMEGVPRTIMEALSAGVQVVSSDLPQIRSAFGDSVAYASEGEVAVFGDQLLNTLNESPNPSLHDEFGWQQTVEETTRVLERLTKAAHPDTS
ncbi:glycosyltransferase family 4 protein [Saliphagus infecundisoli]|uniref:Glycosyltransferase family 4 protein n=1 Tax=Saliphagus infecundisoli TaxID=1849069 RepID=A0ABD5QLA9_9EURY|nr:glycosyltransferase family 4 protein [Saliphagus infecundisoli]